MCTQVPLLLASGIVPALAAGLQVAPVLWGRVVVEPALYYLMVSCDCFSSHRLKGRRC